VEFFILLALIWVGALLFRMPSRSTRFKRAGRRTNAHTGVYPSNPLSTTFSFTEVKASWIPAKQQIEVANHVIPGGWIYLGEGLPSVNGWNLEPALVNPELPVDWTMRDLGWQMKEQWLGYHEFTPAARATYLEWLANGRSNRDIAIGYVFLYFFGLERRVFGKTESSRDPRAETQVIRQEVRRLLGCYSSHASFRRHATNFLDCVEAVVGANGPAGARAAILGREDGIMPWRLRAELGRAAIQRKPVSADVALAWVRLDPNRRLPVAAQRFPEEFTRLFYGFYAQRFGGGMLLWPEGPRLQAAYLPVSPSFSGPIEISFPDLPDVMIQTEVGSRIWEVAEECAGELDGYSRWRSRNADQADGFSSFALLPSSLARIRMPPEVKVLATLLEESVNGSSPLVIEADAILERWPLIEPSRPSPQESVLLAQVFAGLGYGIEPDPRFGERWLEPAGKAVLFHLPEPASSAPSRPYAVASLFVRVVVAAAADGKIPPADIQALAAQVGSALALSQDEQARLRAYQEWMRSQSSMPGRFRQRLEGLDVINSVSIGHFLISVLIAGGPIDPGAVMTLSKVNRALGFDMKLMRTTAILFPRDFKKATGSDIAKVSAILAQLFDEEEPPRPKGAAYPRDDRTGGGKLPPPLAAFLRDLAIQPVWTRAELERLAGTFNLFLDGTIEVCNERALKTDGSLVIRGRGPRDNKPRQGSGVTGLMEPAAVELSVLYNALVQGLTPKRGLHRLQIGREAEFQRLTEEVRRAAGGETHCRFVVGEQGWGKTFFLARARELALSQRLIHTHASYLPGHLDYDRFAGHRGLHAQLMRNLTTHARPAGGAFIGVMERLLAEVAAKASEEGISREFVFYRELKSLQGLPGAGDFLRAMFAYWRGHRMGDAQLQANAERWFHCGFRSASEARLALGVESLMDDLSLSDLLRLLARFIQRAGFPGLLVCLDDLASYCGGASFQIREPIYKQLLGLLAKCQRGMDAGLCVLVSASPEVMTDENLGLLNYPPLRALLDADATPRDGIIIQLNPFTLEDLHEMLIKLQAESKELFPRLEPLPGEAIHAFEKYCALAFGEDFYRTPAQPLRVFVNMLTVMNKNPRVPWQRVIGYLTTQT
jgi:hypothetical protein